MSSEIPSSKHPSQDSAPPQPPLRETMDNENEPDQHSPPIVNGIDNDNEQRQQQSEQQIEQYPQPQEIETDQSTSPTSLKINDTINESTSDINNEILSPPVTASSSSTTVKTVSSTQNDSDVDQINEDKIEKNIENGEESENKIQFVRSGDLAGFSELFARFHSRIEKSSAGRKYRPLREAWDLASDEINKYNDRINLHLVSNLVIESLKLGCESNKIVIVDSCLDCIHRLFEYGHIGSVSDENENSQTNIILDYNSDILDEIIAVVCACLEVKDEDVYLRMVQTLLTAATRTKSGLHQSTLLAAVRTIYNIYLNARMPGTRTTAKVSLTQILNLVFSRMEDESTSDSSISSNFPPFSASSPKRPSLLSEDEESIRHDDLSKMNNTKVASDNTVDDVNNSNANHDEFRSILQRDAYLLFRALCKLSAKEYIDLNTPDTVGIRSKLLSLELIRTLINNSGPAFRNGDRFIYALRQYLSKSLLINCTWNSLQVMDISFDIFEILVRKETLRPLLKNEIHTLFDIVIFRFLQSPNSGSMRKKRVLTLLYRLSTDRQTMADLFLNYDCDINYSNIFEKLVQVISSTAQDKSISSIQEEDNASSNLSNSTNFNVSGIDGNVMDIKAVALSSVIQIVRTLREWSQPLENEKEQQFRKQKIAEGKKDDGNDPANEEEKEDDTATSQLKSPSAVGTISEGSDLDTTRFEEALKAKKHIVEGVKLFNTKPKRGIEYLIKNQRLEEDAEEIAKFLHKAENLDAAMVGEYIGDGGKLNVDVMHAYTDMYDFSRMTFDGALRLLLSGFRLPGEAQKIDRIMERFATRYSQCNPNIFANSDAAYVLAYSAIMLHTDAHNETIKHKMSKEEFIKNNRGINNGGDLDPVFLGKLYDRITTTEIKLSGNKKDSTKSSNGPDDNSISNINGSISENLIMDPVQRIKYFEEESERLLTQSKILFNIRGKPSHDYTYYSATNVTLVKLMFDITWYSILAAISLNLEETTTSTSKDIKIISLCLEGFRHGIAISSTYDLSTTKDAFVSSLAKFTHLNSTSEMKSKNVECVRMILAIAANEGNNLGEQWVLIIRAVSILEQIRAVATGNSEKYLLQKSPLIGIGNNGDTNINNNGNNSEIPPIKVPSGRTSSSLSSPRNSNAGVPMVAGDTFKRISSSAKSTNQSLSNGNGFISDAAKQEEIKKVDAKAAQLAKTVPEGEIEKIFTNSSHLSLSGVCDFCNALCTVALEELSEEPIPRIYCTQKIIEMAYYNIESRTFIQWNSIWEVMSKFFVSVMCHNNRDVSIYSVDVLRQLSLKFLEKEEDASNSTTFQKNFLKPFEASYLKSSKSVQLRELILSCVSQIVLAKALHIKSGWKSIFTVLSYAADDKTETLMNFGWQIVDSITRKYIDVLDSIYVDAINCISTYIRTSSSTPVSLAAIELLCNRCSLSLINIIQNKNQSNDTTMTEIKFSGDDDEHIGLWFPILTGLALAIQDKRSAIRLSANNGLFKVLSNYGNKFSSSMWTLIFRGVLSPIFDDVRHLSESNDKNEAAAVTEWASTTGVTALQSFVDVFVLHLSATRDILEDLLGLIHSWVMQENESVAREGMGIFARLVLKAGEVFTKEDWNRIIKAITKTFEDTMPFEIVGSNEDKELKEGNDIEDSNGGNMNVVNLSPKNSNEDGGNNDDGKIDFRVVRSKCVVQLLLIELVQETVVSFYNKLGSEEIVSMSECLEKSYRFAHKFNADVELRYSLWRRGFMNQVPNLLKQETNGLMCYLRIMFWLYLDEERGKVRQWSEEKVMKLCESVLRRYIHACERAPSKSEERREVAALSPVVMFIVNSMMQMSESQFSENLNELYAILLDLLDSCDDREVRLSVTILLRARVLPSTSQFLARPQLPGAVTSKVLSIQVAPDTRVQTDDEVCSVIEKVGGVRSVKAIDGRTNCFQIATSAPNEMVVAGAMAMPFVKTAFIEDSSTSHRLD